MKIHKSKSFWFILLSILFVGSQIFIFAGSNIEVENRDEKTLAEIKNIIATSDSPKDKLIEIKRSLKHDTYLWYFIGFLGEALFGSRMFVQWIASEKAKKNVIPVAFWYLSLSGSALVFAYALHLRDPVFILSKGTGFFIYIRNIILLIKGKKNTNE